MEDMISKQAAIDAVLTELTKRERKNLLHTWSTVEVKYFVTEMLEHLPSAQPEIIRCKDCKHRPIKGDWNIVYAPDDSNGRDDDTCPCLCDDCCFNWMPEDDFFCKRGERKE